MDVEQFVGDVLKQVSSAVDASDKSTYDFRIKPGSGVKFSLAVSTSSTSGTEKGGAGGVRVKVLSGELNKKSTSSDVHETTSRIEFTVEAYKSQRRSQIL